jgi:hypothetical protein
VLRWFVIQEQTDGASIAVRHSRSNNIFTDNTMGSRDSAGTDAARGLGWLLRAQHDGIIREPLPARWTELINCLDEKERIRLKAELSDGDECTPLKN